MARFVRSSKFRHVFGTPSKRDKCYDNIRISKSPWDSNMSSVNSKFLAVVLEAQGGGSFMVCPLDKVGRYDINYPKVAGHKGLVMDVAWDPFNDNQIASCSEDCSVMIWDIPDGGLSDDLRECKLKLEGHGRKVGHIQWHPCASSILLSAGHDNAIIVWNTKTGERLVSITDLHTDIIYSISWNYNGSYVATTCKDKKIRVIDIRNEDLIAEGQGHVGTKPSRAVFCGTSNRIFTTGFSRSSDRQYALWDPHNLDSALTMENIDTSSGVLFPVWDAGTDMIYLVGKGDTQVRLFEVTSEKPFVHYLTTHQGTTPYRGACVMPKRECKYMECEVMRFFFLMSKGWVEPVSMTVPRKSGMFQDDIFPDCPSSCPALTADEWMAGENKDPLLLKFTPDGIIDASGAPVHATKTIKKQEKKPEGEAKPVAVKSSAPVSKGIANKTAELKRQASGGGKDASPSLSASARNEPQTLEEYKTAYRKFLRENKLLYIKAYRQLLQENELLYRKVYKELVEENEMLKGKLAELQK